MKKLLAVLFAMLLLTGCSASQTFETISDLVDVPVMAQMQQLELALPEDAAVLSIESSDVGTLYFCDGYTLCVQTMAAGNLNETIYQLTGFEKTKLTLMQTQQNGADRYECVWSAAGESGDQVGRAVILDDGNYHYSVTTMASAEDAGALSSAWQTIFDSVKLVNTD